uniref:Uncharacterized protein n=1 Tax=Anguilla anguilla TaxID=7936 RepID=A0A0E9XLD0_ANGAN
MTVRLTGAFKREQASVLSLIFISVLPGQLCTGHRS